MLTVEAHPLLDLIAFEATFAAPLAECPTPAAVGALLRAEAPAPLAADDAVRTAVRDLLRAGGFKPTGRSKPSAEYLLRAAREGAMPSINVAVDVGNAVSLHSGLPVSVVDADRLRPPLRVGLGGADDRAVFNAAGQVIDLAGLLCLFDAEGPTATPVKDAQRTKTDGATHRTLQLVWGTKALAGRATQTAAWYRALLEQTGATVGP